MEWTHERIELLKKLWADGCSASHIANCLGGVTRNAVIGKAARLHLVRDEAEVRRARRKSGEISGRAVAAKARAIAARKPAWMPKDIKPTTTVVHVSRITGGIVSGPKPTPPAPPPASEPARGTSLTLLELTATSCRWPIDPSGDDGWRFCGKERDPKALKSCYCAEHWRRSRGQRQTAVAA